MYGTLNQQSTGMTEEEEERRREKRIRQQIREKLQEEKSEWKRKNRKMTGCRNYSNTFLRWYKLGLCRGGSVLSRKSQTSLSPATSASCSWRIPRQVS